MLTIKQNLQETIKGGNPDRFVKQYEFMELILEIPGSVMPMPGQILKKNEWGIIFSWPEDQIGCFPVHDDEHKLLKDITKWKEAVKAPELDFPDEDWAAAVEHANAIDRNEKYVASFMAPGVFEMTHHMMGMEDAMMNLYEEPELMHELIDFLTEFEINKARRIIDHIHPNAVFHHDDWGGQISTFMSPGMFEEFFVEPYKKIYQFWKDNGAEIVVHHSDSFGETLVPYMVEMGIDIWQGVMTTNDIPKLINEYGGKISFMGGVDSGPLDHQAWNADDINEHVEKACKQCGKHYFIPCLTQGGPYSSFPGVYDAASAAIDKMSAELF
jgi:hypothetical protein